MAAHGDLLIRRHSTIQDAVPDLCSDPPASVPQPVLVLPHLAHPFPVSEPECHKCRSSAHFATLRSAIFSSELADERSEDEDSADEDEAEAKEKTK